MDRRKFHLGRKRLRQRMCSCSSNNTICSSLPATHVRSSGARCRIKHQSATFTFWCRIDDRKRQPESPVRDRLEAESYIWPFRSLPTRSGGVTEIGGSPKSLFISETQKPLKLVRPARFGETADAAAAWDIATVLQWHPFTRFAPRCHSLRLCGLAMESPRLSELYVKYSYCLPPRFGDRNTRKREY
ncbi:hypothetical protein CEXT_312891 [Caerostris extrusa]|uniref:Uncharacterized protein n=1 Tax=Caerostris extrusa TaxID=172846 RepID=A0AAV4SB24_CAEEX|nr:hypothetical protein CEXT_312891 [Caerostris extrusa]